MNKFKYLSVILTLLVFFTGCGVGGHKVVDKLQLQTPSYSSASEAVLKFMERGGDYINQKNAPYLLPNDDVFYNGKDYLVIDIRDSADYVAGHINGAVRVDVNKIFAYLEKKGAGQYDKVVIAGNTGINSSYVASVLRAAGYNAFPLKEGMASWNKVFTHYWTDGVSSAYASKVTDKAFEKAPKGKLPQLKVKQDFAGLMLKERAQKVIGDNFIVTVDDVMKNAGDYYIVAYLPKAKYDVAHLPGAVQYTPKKSLKLDAELTTLPTDKKIAVYCYTGQHAAAVTGFLRILGYDAYVIDKGMNGIMFSKVKTYGWHPYVASEKVKDYPLVKGNKPSDKKVVAVAKKQSAGPAPVIKRKKKEAAGGGCD